MPTSLHRLLTLWFLATMGVGCTKPLPRNVWTPAETILTSPPVTVPLIEDATGAFLVDVTLNDQGPYRLLVDTGAYGLLLAEDVAAAIHASPVKRARIYVQNTSGRRIKAQRIVRIASLGLGAMQFHDVHAYVHERSVVALPTAQAHDGVLGIGVFYDTLLLLDLPNRILRLSSGVLPPDNEFVTPTVNVPRTPPCIDLHLQPVGGPTFTCPAVVDTGATTLTLPARARQWPLSQTPVRDVLHTEIGGNRYALSMVRIQSNVVLGKTGCQFVDPILGFHGRQGRLGIPILRQTVLIFDQRHQRVALVPDDRRLVLKQLLYRASQNFTDN